MAGEGDPALERLCMVLPMGTQIIFPRNETDFLKATIYIYTHAYVNKHVVNLFDTLTYVNKYAEHFKGT